MLADDLYGGADRKEGFWMRKRLARMLKYRTSLRNLGNWQWHSGCSKGYSEERVLQQIKKSLESSRILAR